MRCLANDCQARVLSKHGLSECSRWAYPPDRPPDRPKSCSVHDILERRRRAAENAIQSFDAEGYENALLTAATSSSEGVSESAPFVEGGSESAPVDEGGSQVGSEGDDGTVPPVPPEPPDDGLDRDAYIARKVAFALYLEDGSFDASEGRFELDGVLNESLLDAFCCARGTFDSFLSMTRLLNKMTSRRHYESAQETMARVASYLPQLVVCRMISHS